MMDRAAFCLLCAVVFTIPWEKSVVLAGAGTLTRALGALAFTAGAASALARRQLRAPHLALVFAAGFTAWSALTWFWSYDRDATLVRSFTYAQLLVLAWLVWDLCRTAERQTVLLAMYVSGASVSSLATFGRWALQQQTYYRRFAAPGFDPNDLAITVALSIPMALYLARRAAGAAVWVWSACAALAAGAILLTGSRTATIAAVVGFGFAALAWRGAGAAFRIGALLAFAVLPVGLLWLAPEASRERIHTTPGEITRGTLHKRTQIWKAGLRALRQRPVVGVGSGAYPDAVKPWLGVPPVAGHEYVAHNSFLSVLVETGWIGAALFGGVLLAVGLFVWVLDGLERWLWAVTLCVWLTGASMLTWEHRKPTWLLMALVATEWARAFRSRGSAAVPE